MTTRDRIRADLGAAVGAAGDDRGALQAADRLCQVCVELLDVDGAAVSVLHEGVTQGTFGSSGALSRQLDEYQFTFGEGPCLDAVRIGRPVLVPDVAQDLRWPVFAAAVADAGVRAVFALPVAIAGSPVGALDLFRSSPGLLSTETLDAGMWAAQLASLPLLDLMSSDLDWAVAGEGGDGWEQLASLERVEVYQATGMLMAQWDITGAEALVRLRSYAFSQGLTASELAWAVVERQAVPDPGGSWTWRSRPERRAP